MLFLLDTQIDAMICEAKTIPDGLCPLTRPIERNQHRRKEFEITCATGSSFVIATRQSMLNSQDFSVILGYRNPGFNTIFRLRRYNGKSHYHTNTIETETFREFHIHTATERYQKRGPREDHFAKIDTRYWDLASAIQCLLNDCGFRSPIDNSPLFTGNPE
jgi:hypothetical protein